MKPVLFYDTETSGLPLFDQPSEDPRQPHIVQVGGLLVDLDSRKVISALDVIVRPEGWTIPDEVARVHGITNEHAAAVGVAESMAVGMLMELWERAEFRVAHNEPFDARILRIGLMRHESAKHADLWKAGLAECTAALATPILKIPPTAKMLRAGFNKFKTANLGEAFEFFTGRKLEGAHRAIVDCEACLQVYFAIKDGITQPQREAVAA